MRRLLTMLLALALLSIAPQATRADMLRSVSGPIERLDKSGHLTVDGETAAITEHTEIRTPGGERASQRELGVGVLVEMTYTDGVGGNEATSIVATILR